MPLGPGSGICCGYTMTRAILGDAVALVRGETVSSRFLLYDADELYVAGDRFYTTDYTRKLA